MPIYSVVKSSLQRFGFVARFRGRPGATLLRPRSGPEWLTYFRANAARHRPVPHPAAGDIDPAEVRPIADSLRGWQLGETSDGHHLRAAAAGFSAQIGDPAYLLAVDLFIREEQRHGSLLGRWLDAAGIGRAKKDWGDSLFRLARYFLRNMEAWTTPVVMVETLALVYYNAIRRATRSAALREICKQILSDEIAHLRFACERLACLYRRRNRLGFRLTMAIQRCLFAAVVALVWAGHRRALRAGEYGWCHFRRAARDRMNACWRLMDPRRYDWSEWPGR